MVHRREVSGTEIVLGNQGALFKGAMTWWDHDTGSIWSQPLGRAIAGPREGTTLELLPVQMVAWERWRRLHPGTLALDMPAGSFGLTIDDMAIVVDLTDEAVLFDPMAVREAGVVNEVVAGAELLVAMHGDGWVVFSRRLEDRTLEFDRVGDELIDRQTRTRWDLVRGQARDGPLRGSQLGALPSFTSYPADFVRFWPDGRVWP